MLFVMRILSVFAGCVLLILPASAEKFGPEVQKSIDLVRSHIDKLGAKGAGEIIPRVSQGLEQVFPDRHFIIVRFRVYPVARILPAGLKASNIFVVSNKGQVEYLQDAKTLEKFVRLQQAAAKSAKDAKTLLSAWLLLSQEFHQDGLFQFEILDKEFAIDGEPVAKVSGRAMVKQGGNGQLHAELLFDKEGKLSMVLEKAAIRRGPRPICQATKLLDADPVVRRIVEQDLLIMGLSARDYLMEQRNLATPELRQAIDRIWQQILKNGW